MGASKEWVAAIGSGVVLATLLVWFAVGWLSRTRDARRARRAERFREAVRSEAARLVRERTTETEMDEFGLTRVFERPDVSHLASGITRVERRRLEEATAGDVAVDATAPTRIFDRRAVLEVLGDEAG